MLRRNEHLKMYYMNGSPWKEAWWYFKWTLVWGIVALLIFLTCATPLLDSSYGIYG